MPRPNGIAPVPKDEVTAALELVLASPAFARVERPARFLRHLVERTLEGESTTLKESVLGLEVFGRDASWNPSVDPVVRQEAARLRNRLARYYAGQDTPTRVRIDIPTGSYVPVFSWQNNATPVEAAAAETVAPAEASAGRRGRAWHLWIGGILTIAIAAGIWIIRPAKRAAAASIVVLPFANLSSDSANEYFADGLTDEITNELSRVAGMRVIARASAFTFKGKHADVRDVGRQLDAAYVLEGSVERSQDQIRVSAHLERTSDGSHVWSATYDRRAQDLLGVQEELAQGITRSLQRPDLTAGHRPVPEAHELAMQAAFEMQNITPGALSRAEQKLELAVAVDPQYAQAWLELGVVRYNKGAATTRGLTTGEIDAAMDLYRKALELDPSLTGARANLALATMVSRWDWPEAEHELRLASEGPPHPFVYVVRALYLSWRGRFREADQQIELARSLDPVGTVTLTYMAGIRYWEERYAESIAISRELAERYPEQANPQLVLNPAYIDSGQCGAAMANLQQHTRRFPTLRVLEVRALARCGQRDEALRLVKQLETEYAENRAMPRFFLAIAWAALEDHGRTIAWLERSADVHEFQILNIAVNPALKQMRNDAAFRALVKRIGLP